MAEMIVCLGDSPLLNRDIKLSHSKDMPAFGLTMMLEAIGKTSSLELGERRS